MMAFGPGVDPCEECEKLLQPFLDRELSEDERAEAQRHLDDCSYCAKRFRFERQAAVEEMTPQLKQKLAALRTPLV